jgi:hypothetical protein
MKDEGSPFRRYSSTPRIPLHLQNIGGNIKFKRLKEKNSSPKI